MRNADYWRSRSEQVLLENERRGNRYLNQINRAYRLASEHVGGEAARIFNTYRGGFSPGEALQWLNEDMPRADYERLKASLSSITDERLRRETLLRLNAPAYRYRISRMDYIGEQALAELSRAADIQLTLGDACRRDALDFAYNRTRFDLQQGVGVAFDFARLAPSAVSVLLKTKWYGRNFSSSVWRNTYITATSAADILRAGLLTGQSVPQMAKTLIEKTHNASMYNASRLIRTEVNHLTTQGALESYREAGLDSYEYLATLEAGVTCEICTALDGKTFSMEEERPGKNSPPMHPFCRCTVIPIINEPGLKRINMRAARDPQTGKTVVIEDMNYDQWKEKFGPKPIAKIPKSGIIGVGRDGMTISGIETPIEQRNTGKGNPNAILQFDRPLNSRQAKLLDSLKEYDSQTMVNKKSVNMKDLSALTAHTGDEFALFTKGKECLVIRGNTRMVNVGTALAEELAMQGYKWSGHTHPGFDSNSLTASPGDYRILDCFNQTVACIYNSKGNWNTFEKG